jgi:hypothetical protein
MIRNQIFRDLLLGFLLALSCIIFQHGPDLFSLFVQTKVPESLSYNPTNWTADIRGVPPGIYYISVGSPRCICDLHADKVLIASNRSRFPQVHSSAFMSADLVIKFTGEYSQLSLDCPETQGFKGVSSRPLIATYYWGQIINTWRELNDLALGPVTSLLFLLAYLIFVFSRRPREPVLSKFLFLAVCAVLYTLSLATITRLFIDGLTLYFSFFPVIESDAYYLASNLYSLLLYWFSLLQTRMF